MTRSLRALALLALSLPLTLAACGTPPAATRDLDALDNDLADGAANGTDPALAAALHAPLMVDPALAQASNANAVRPPPHPDDGAVPADDLAAGAMPKATGPLRPAPAPRGDCPSCVAAKGALTLGALATRQRDPGIAGCGARVSYATSWSTRLPAELPLYPDARVSEAAGADSDACHLRIVSFASSAPVARVIDWYHTRATQAGYSASHEADGTCHVLGGTRRDAAYVVYVRARAAGGSNVDFVTNMGR